MSSNILPSLAWDLNWWFLTQDSWAMSLYFTTTGLLEDPRHCTARKFRPPLSSDTEAMTSFTFSMNKTIFCSHILRWQLLSRQVLYCIIAVHYQLLENGIFPCPSGKILIVRVSYKRLDKPQLVLFTFAWVTCPECWRNTGQNHAGLKGQNLEV